MELGARKVMGVRMVGEGRVGLGGWVEDGGCAEGV